MAKRKSRLVVARMKEGFVDTLNVGLVWILEGGNWVGEGEVGVANPKGLRGIGEEIIQSGRNGMELGRGTRNGCGFVVWIWILDFVLPFTPKSKISSV
jgi:hypothetical protein